ncbi:unnamed protein product [Symbiodinium sp. CCMP2592]|nr:unnamed protein product [Symbiodinium sp. CCMP2592]
MSREGKGADDTPSERQLRVHKLSGDCVLELPREEAWELKAADLASQLSEPLQVSAYRLSFAILGRKLEDEVGSL